MMKRVIITDCGGRKSLPVVRSLGERGIIVTGGESSRFALSFFSKYCKERFIYPSPVTHPGEFIESIIEHLKQNKYDALIPLEDESSLILSQHKEKISEYTNLPLADPEILKNVQDKAFVLKVAREIGVPLPETYFPENTKELEDLKNKLDYPVVIKPRRSSGSRGIVYVKSKDELILQYLRVEKDFPSPLIQEYIPSPAQSLGVSVLFDKSQRAVAIFSHKRIREFPVAGGPSTLRESIKNPELEKITLKLLKALNWYGVAMVEYRVDPRDGQAKLMEINPRFWGSIALAVYAGVDFPYLLYKVALGEKIKSVTDYSVGLKCRWLIPGDILHFIKNPRRFKLVPGFFNFFDKRTKYDILSMNDPLPAFGFFVITLRYLFSRKMWRHTFIR